MPEQKMTPEQYLKIFEGLKASRANYESTWQDVSHYCLPRKAFITRQKTPGSKFDFDVYDSTAMQSALVLAAGLHSYLTNPASKWFTLRMREAELMDIVEVRKWLKDVEDKIYDVLNNSNFSEQVHEVYLDMSVFGPAFLYEEEDVKTTVRFFCRPVAECYIVEDERGRVNQVYREFEWTAYQCYEQWGDAAGEVVKKAMDDKDYEKKIKILHIIHPRYQRDTSKADSINMEYASVYIEVDKRRVINESGYQEFPLFVPRFNKDSNDVYGSSPATVSYADIKMVNEMVYTIIRAGQKVVDPPIMLPHDGYLLPIKLGPAAINYKLSGNAQDRVEPLMTNANIPVGLELVDSTRMIIKRNFFVDLFLLLADPAKKDMTATEVMQRVEEKMLILAPTLGRLMSELLDPIIHRTFMILLRNQKIPPPPAALEGRDYVVEYTSPLARAQKLEEMKSINQVIGILGGVAQVVPDVIDNVDTDELIKEIASLYNISPKLLRDEKEVAQIRVARQQQLEQQAKIANLKMIADAASSGAQAVKTGKEAANVGQEQAK